MVSVVVVGSINADLVISAPRLPLVGETIAGSDLMVFPGGKGANQACAAAKAGARARMFGRVGDDAFGRMLTERLQAAGVDSAGVQVIGRSTGAAAITVLPDGDNAILLSPGANASVDPDFVAASLRHLSRSDIVLSQLEIPLASVECILQLASAKGATCILDPAPAQALPPPLMRLPAWITPNQTEAAELIGNGSPPVRTMCDAAEACRKLRELGARSIIVKMGEMGCFVSEGECEYSIPALRVDAVDTTAAGDTFNGALAAVLAEGAATRDAILLATTAAAISVTRHGAQDSIPSRQEVDRLLRSTTGNNSLDR